MSTCCMTSRSIYTPVGARSYTFLTKYRHSLSKILLPLYLQVCTCMGDKRVFTIQEWLVGSYFIYLNIHRSFNFLITSPCRFVCVCGFLPSSDVNLHDDVNERTLKAPFHNRSSYIHRFTQRKESWLYTMSQNVGVLCLQNKCWNESTPIMHAYP